MSKVLKNSAAAVAFDFNTELTAILSANTVIEGKELRLAVAIYGEPTIFPIASIFGASNDKKRGERMETALSANCVAFAVTFNDAKMTAKALESIKGLRRLETEASRDKARRTISAARALFERALSISYMFQSCGAIISKVTPGTVAFNPTRNVKEDGVELTVGKAETWTRNDCYKAGRALLKVRGILSATKSGKRGAGNGTVQNIGGKTLLETATIMASTVGALPAADKVEITTSESFEKMMWTVIRARYAHDGVISVSEFIADAHKADAMKGVSINVDVKATATPRKVAKAA